MKFCEIAQRPRAKFLHDARRLLLHLRTASLLEFGAETQRQRVHLAHVLRAGHDGCRGDDRVFFRVSAHPQLEICHALLRELPLCERLLGELVEQAPRHPVRRQRL